VGSLCGDLNWPGIDHGGNAGQDGDERDTRSGYVQAAGAVPEQPAPVYEPAKAAFHHPSAIEHDKALWAGSRSTTQP
jgi:hypothetical protein